MPPKAKKVHNLTVLLLDANSTANETTTSTGVTDFDISAAMVDSIMCQKIFNGSGGKCSIVAFGFEREPQGCHVVCDLEMPIFFTLERLEEVKPGTTTTVPIQKGIEFAINQVNDFARENPNLTFKSTIYLFSNLNSTPAATMTDALAKKLAKELKEEEIELIVCSPDEVFNDEKSPKIKFMGILGAKADAKWLPFSECKDRFEPFMPKETMLRGMPFDLKLDKNVNIKLQMYVKNKPGTLDNKYSLCTSEGNEIKKHFEHTTRPDIQIEMADVDNIEDSEIINNQFKKAEENKRTLDKEDLIKAFYYGKTAVPTDEDLKAEFKDVKFGKELRLIQFTSRDNILPQFFMTTPRYLLPVKDTYGSQRVLHSLVKELLDKDLVAVARYAYNANSSARIVCLIPKITKSGLPIFIHYQIPYGDDVRTYEFAYLDTEANQPDEFQKDAIDAFVDGLMLDDNDFRPKNTPNPKVQNEGFMLRQKAIDMGDPVVKYQFFDRCTAKLRMPDEKKEIASSLQDAFNLQPTEARAKVFGSRGMGVDPIEVAEAVDGNGVDSVAKKEEEKFSM